MSCELEFGDENGCLLHRVLGIFVRAHMQAREAMKHAIAVVSALGICGLFCCCLPAQVTPQRLLDSAKEPQNWLTYSGD